MTVFEQYKGKLQPDGLHVPITFCHDILSLLDVVCPNEFIKYLYKGFSFHQFFIVNNEKHNNMKYLIDDFVPGWKFYCSMNWYQSKKRIHATNF